VAGIVTHRGFEFFDRLLKKGLVFGHGQAQGEMNIGLFGIDMVFRPPALFVLLDERGHDPLKQ